MFKALNVHNCEPITFDLGKHDIGFEISWNPFQHIPNRF
jgi:hypothetical protein